MQTPATGLGRTRNLIKAAKLITYAPHVLLPNLRARRIVKYAENATGAVSCTDAHELRIHFSLAKEICMYPKTLSPAHAARPSLKRFLKSGEALTLPQN
jgi:hypothetical protein